MYYNLNEVADFMIQNIFATKDKKIFEKCSDKLKADYNFVKRVMKIFKSDKDFLMHIINVFLEKNENIVNHFDILYWGSFLIENQYEALALKKKAMLLLDEEINGIESNVFLNIMEKHDKVIVPFIAEQLVNKVLDGISLEKMMVSTFKNKDDFDQYGHLLFLASVINKSDSDLANYVLANSYVANSALNVLHWSSKNWNDTKIQIFYEEITRVLKKFPNVENKWNVYDIACYYAEKHNALDEFRNYEARYTGDSTGKTMIDLVLSSHNEFSSFGYKTSQDEIEVINELDDIYKKLWKNEFDIKRA